MTFSVDPYMSREFHQERYNCWDLLREAWLELTGFDIGHRTPAPASPLAMIRRFDREESQFVRLPGPVSPSIVLMRRPRLVPHVGLFWRSKVLHIKETGPRYERRADAMFGFIEERFYTNADGHADRQPARPHDVGNG